jgi:hypothetical protein
LKADAALKELRDTLTEKESVLNEMNNERTFYYWAKCYHVQSKNYAR